MTGSAETLPAPGTMPMRDYGRTGIKVSALSYGAMRLPRMPDGGVDFDRAVEVMRLAFSRGVNLVDSCWGYHDGQSEVAIGRALDGWKGAPVFVQTKAVYYRDREPGEDDRTDLDEELRRIGRPIDFYLMHGLSCKRFEKFGRAWLAVAEKALAAGEVRHLGFSTHDTSENVRRLIDIGAFEAMVIQYNLLDRQYADVIAYARERGLGVAIMGPVGGGRLAAPSDVLVPHVPPDAAPGSEAQRNAELSLRFVLANPHVCTAMSGMTTAEMVERNLATVERGALSSDAISKLLAAVEARKPMHDTGCTSCGYCKPCDALIQVPRILGMVATYRVWGLHESARRNYAQTGPGKWIGSRADACVDCGKCEERCPQKLPIRELLREAHELLSPKP